MTTPLDAAVAQLGPVKVIYTDLDNTLLGPAGSLLTAADGSPTARPAAGLVAAAEHGITVVPVSGRGLRQLRNDARLMGLTDCIAEAGAVILRNDEVRYEWGECPRDLAANPHDAMLVSGALEAVMAAFPGDIRLFEPWHRGREGGHLLHGRVDTAVADRALAAAGCDWAYLRDNGATGGWEGRRVRAYHLLPRGVGKAPAVADDLRARGLQPSEAVAIGDSIEDLTMAPEVGLFVMVANGHAPSDGSVVSAPGAMGEGFADVVEAVVRAQARAPR